MNSVIKHDGMASIPKLTQPEIPSEETLEPSRSLAKAHCQLLALHIVFYAPKIQYSSLTLRV